MGKFWLLLPVPLLFLAYAYYHLGVRSYQGPDVLFEIQPGEGFSSINGRLRDQNLIGSAAFFHRYNQLMGNLTQFRAGQYRIKNRSTMLDIIATLKRGDAITISVTLPEGKNLFEIAAILESKDVIRSKERFIALAKNADFTRQLNLPGERIEGYLYPETYRFTRHSTGEQVIKSMVKTFKRKAAGLNFSDAPLGLNRHQVVILASIVEKETGAGHERPVIAGVFINRLKRRMRLQSDPTTIYGIFENFNGNLRKKDLLQKTPYNTYKIAGLPKGPISNPGLKSLAAVLNPAEHSYLYFVSRNDGTHTFSKSYREHRQAVNKFQKDWRARRGKSWRDLKKSQ